MVEISDSGGDLGNLDGISVGTSPLLQQRTAPPMRAGRAPRAASGSARPQFLSFSAFAIETAEKIIGENEAGIPSFPFPFVKRSRTAVKNDSSVLSLQISQDCCPR